MKVSVISFTEKGIQLSEAIAGKLDNMECRLFTKCSAYLKGEQKQAVTFVERSVGEWAGEQMEEKNALLFIGACGIAVRAIAPGVINKLQDSPVLVMDEKGRHVIPILSGHMGGANELALFIAEKTGAEPVITTATDIRHKFAVDLFAKKNKLSIVNKDGIARVSARVLSGEPVLLSVEPGHWDADSRLPEGLRLAAYPPTRPVDIVVSSENRVFDTAILLRPREYVIGMGCRRGKEAEQIEALIRRSMEVLGITELQIAALASIDVKSSEPGLLAWSARKNVPFLTYTAEELQEVAGDFHTSEFVRSTVGVDNVCERAALKACGPGGRLVYEKHGEDGMTIAVARKEWSVRFDEA